VFSLVRSEQPESVHAVGSMISMTYARTKGNADFLWFCRVWRDSSCSENYFITNIKLVFAGTIIPDRVKLDFPVVIKSIW